MADIKLFEYYYILPTFATGQSGCGRFCRLTKFDTTIELIDYDYQIDEIDEARYGLTAGIYLVPDQEYEAINTYINEEHIFERMKEPLPTPTPQEKLIMMSMIGQSGSTQGVRLTLSNDETACRTNPIASELRMLLDLREKCGEPVDKLRGLSVTPLGVSMPPAYRYRQNNITLPPNAWECPYCGEKANTGKFCMECGQPKQ